jgi:hypothetical protein
MPTRQAKTWDEVGFMPVAARALTIPVSDTDKG